MMVALHRYLGRSFKPAVFALCLLPFALLSWRAWQGALGANPIETLTHATGDWTLRLLMVTLALSPLRRLTGWQRWMSVRRMLGLFTVFYATLHFAVYLVFDHFFDWAEILRDIVKRPYITVGFTAFVMLVPLALTSNRWSMRALGRRWQQLHRTVYLIAPLGVVHYWWSVKADIRLPLLHAAIVCLLLALRVFRR